MDGIRSDKQALLRMYNSPQCFLWSTHHLRGSGVYTKLLRGLLMKLFRWTAHHTKLLVRRTGEHTADLLLRRSGEHTNLLLL